MTRCILRRALGTRGARGTWQFRRDLLGAVGVIVTTRRSSIGSRGERTDPRAAG